MTLVRCVAPALALGAGLLAVWLHGAPPPPPNHQQALFRQIFGDRIVAIDPAIRAKLLSRPPGERIKLDTDGDGKIDTIYFIDDDPKHQAQFRPILVKAIDRDGDMDRDGDADLDSDLYVVDWNADGIVDTVVEYRDTDHDNGLDEMAIYTYSAHDRDLGTDAIQVWWSRDVGHHHQLWDTINYRYQQAEAQFRTYFGGDEIFASYIFDSRHARWIPSWENPFVFYDEDGDDLAEVTMRFSGSGNQMQSMRYGFDADNDTAGDNPHDYDFSFTCLASRTAGDHTTVPVPAALMEHIDLPGGPAEPLLAWKYARKFGEHAPWGKVLLTWVENDNNVDSQPGGDPHQRWEGVISSGSEFFPQIGGPPVGPYNARYEVDTDNSGKMKLYYLPADRRLHLLGADQSWLKVDYNFDGKMDMEFRYRDTDGDGKIDTLEVDTDGDGRPDHTIHLPHGPAPLVALDYKPLVAFYNSVLDEALAQNQLVIDAMKGVLRAAEPAFREDPVETYFQRDLVNYHHEFGIGERIRNSRGGTRYYQDLIRERYFVRLRTALAGKPLLLRAFEARYDAGDYAGAAKLLSSPRPEWHDAFTHRLTVSVTNPGSTWRLDEPVVLPVTRLRRMAPDFNPRNFVVVDRPRRIADRERPSQADDLDGDGAADEVVFLADLRPGETARYYVYYSPQSGSARHYPPQANASTGPDGGVAWESKWIGYRFEGGGISLIGKDAGAGPGIRVLDPDGTSGIGGAVLWNGARAKPLRGTGRILAAGPVRVTVGLDLGEATVRSSMYANGRYAENHVRFQKTAHFGPAFMKLANDHCFFDPAAGYFGSWGRQNNRVQEVGQAAVFAPRRAALKDGDKERRLVFTTVPGQDLTWYTIGDWRRGRTFPVAPTEINWRKETRALAARLHTPAVIAIGAAERRPATSRQQ